MRTTTLRTAAEITAEPTDAELLQNFVPNVRRRVWPEAQVSYNGTQMSYAKASELERENYLKHARARWHQQRKEAARVAAAAAEREQQQKLFLERCSKGFYRKALKEELAKYGEIYDAGCKLAGELAAAQTAKAKLTADTETDITKTAKALAEHDDLINVLSNRLHALGKRCEKEEQALRSAIQDARRELCQQWSALRQPLLKEAEQLIKKILKVDNYEAKKLAERAHLVVELDGAADCNRGEASWAYTNDLVRLAHEVEERFVRLQSYVNSPAYVTAAKSLPISQDNYGIDPV